MSSSLYHQIGAPQVSAVRSRLPIKVILFVVIGIVLLSTSGIFGYRNREQISASLSQLSSYGTSSNRTSTENGLPPIDWSINGRGTWKTGFLRPSVGSASWHARYPGPEPGPEPRPEWMMHYEVAKTRGLIVPIPQATLQIPSGLAEYPPGTELDEQLCSYRRTSCIAPTDILRGPPSTWAINFDDGPLPPSSTLHTFLRKERKVGTHFYIGDNVRINWKLALEAEEQGEHLAVHTWTHCHLTTRTDEEIIGELGWTMQIIYDLTGHIPRYYRPPYGDVDARVRSLARHVLGLRTVLWNGDSADWSLNLTNARGEFVDAPLGDWFTMETSAQQLTDRMKQTKDEGVIPLEHELSDESVEVFMRTFPSLARHEWTTGSVPDLLDRACDPLANF